jgi:tetratricopeptide (TPR) repeat protein
MPADLKLRRGELDDILPPLTKESVMKSLLLATAAVLSVTAAATPAQAQKISFGESLASACYRSSVQGIGTWDALEECDRALEEGMLDRPDTASTLVNRGVVKMYLSDFRGAESDFDKALSIDPNSPEAHLNKGFLRLRAKDYRAAVPLFDRSIEGRTLKPALAHYARALAQEELGNVRAAYNDLVKARDLAPQWSLPSMDLARFKVSGR